MKMIRKIDSKNELDVHPSPNHAIEDEKMVRVLIAYATRYGATADTAEVISQTLENEYSVKVDILDLKTKGLTIDLQEYDAVIVGSSIVMGRWAKEAQNFIKSNFAGVKVAVYLCAAYSCGKAIAEGESIEYEKHLKKLVDKPLSEYSLVPISMRGFGGRVVFRGNTTLDNWNRNDVIEWSRELGDIVTKTKEVYE
jgi:menaquinone-dependent protoporphyrinogen IX oxidase